MSATTTEVGLEQHGIDPSGEVLRNPTTSQLYADALRRGDGRLAEGGPLVVDTGEFTGRSPKDKFVVREPGSRGADLVGRHQRAARRGALRRAPAEGRRLPRGAQERLYVIDAFAGADPAHRIGVRVITASPYHALFAKTMFIRPTDEELDAARAGGARAPRAGGRGRPGRRRHAHRRLRRAPSEPHRGRDRRHLLRRRDQEVDLHRHERPVAARGRLPDALLGERRPGR